MMHEFSIFNWLVQNFVQLTYCAFTYIAFKPFPHRRSRIPLGDYHVFVSFVRINQSLYAQKPRPTIKFFLHSLHYFPNFVFVNWRHIALRHSNDFAKWNRSNARHFFTFPLYYRPMTFTLFLEPKALAFLLQLDSAPPNL